MCLPLNWAINNLVIILNPLPLSFRLVVRRFLAAVPTLESVGEQLSSTFLFPLLVASAPPGLGKRDDSQCDLFVTGESALTYLCSQFIPVVALVVK